MKNKRLIRKSTITLLLAILILIFNLPALESASNHLKRAEKLISSIRGALDHVAIEIRRATEKRDASLVNCLRQKYAAMKNYEKASLRNQENLRSAWKVKDMKEADRFLKLIEAAHKNVKEIEDKIKECYRGEVIEKKTKVMMIKPEGAEEELIEELFPEEEEGGGPEGFPPVPPASPFR